MKRRSRNEGSIFCRQSKKLRVAKTTLPDGKNRLKYAREQKAVREWLQAQQSQPRQGLLPKDDTVTVAQFHANHMETVGKHTLRPKTIEPYS